MPFYHSSRQNIYRMMFETNYTLNTILRLDVTFTHNITFLCDDVLNVNYLGQFLRREGEGVREGGREGGRGGGREGGRGGGREQGGWDGWMDGWMEGVREG